MRPECAGVSVQPVDAQIYSQFEVVTVSVDFED